MERYSGCEKVARRPVAPRVIERYGSEPNITYFETAIVVDNLAQTIEEAAGA